MSGKEKRYFWFKMEDNWFQKKEIKKLRSIAGGDTYVIIYLKIILLSLKHGGKLYFEGIDETFAAEIALEINENKDNVLVTLEYLLRHSSIIQTEENEYQVNDISGLIGTETSTAIRVRKHREMLKMLAPPKKEPKTNAERQRAHKAKKNCEAMQHIPFVEDYNNNTRYSGNYYIVMQRDRFKCSICGSIEKLCVHHIDGFDEKRPENNNANKLIVLCRECHSKIHAKSLLFPSGLLDSIGYNDGNEGNETCNADVTLVKQNDNGETEIETEIELETEIEIEKERIGGEAPRVRPEAFPLSSIKTLFGVWIEAGLRKHKWETVEFTITNDNYKKKKYSKPLIGVGFDAIKDAIINYGEIMGDHDEYWFSHQYDFWDFLARGFSKFLPDAEPKLKFRRREEERFDRKKTVVEETAKQRRERLQREGVI